MRYGDLIRDAFWLTWRNRFLWVFGLFVGGGSSFNFNVPSGSGDFGDDPGSPSGGAPPGDFSPGGAPEIVTNPERWVSENLGLILVIAALVVLLVLVLIFLRVLSQGALADSAAALDRGEERRFSSTFRAGLSHFWRVLGLDLVLLLISIVVLLMVFVPVGLIFLAIFAADVSGVAIFFAVLFVALAVITFLILVFVPLGIVGELALRELVLGGGRVFGSLGAGFALFWGSLGRVLLVWIILVGLSLAAGIALLVVGLIAGLAIFVPVFALISADLTAAAIIAGVVGALILLVPFLIISGAIGAFQSSYWTLAYLRLSSPRPGEAA